MTDFRFVRLGLSYTSISLSNATGKKNIETGFVQKRTGEDELKRGENPSFFSDLDKLYTAIRLMITNSIKEFTLSSNIFVLQDFNTLQVQHPDIMNRFALRVPCYAFRFIHSIFCIEL